MYSLGLDPSVVGGGIVPPLTQAPVLDLRIDPRLARGFIPRGVSIPLPKTESGETPAPKKIPWLLLGLGALGVFVAWRALRRKGVTT